jgi:uncharacterized protein YcgL (UPF0745 family)
MQCIVYRSSVKSNTYLYVPEKGEFAHIPVTLMKLFGTPEFALEFELTPNRKLAAAEAKEVLRSLSQQGFYLQIPTENEYPL